MKKYLLIAALSVTSLLTIAQDAPAPKTDNPFSFLLNIFSPKPAKLTKLIDEKSLTEADDYLASERQYFLVENKKEHLELLKRLSVALNAMYEPEMDISIAALSKVTDVEPGDWRSHREIVKTSEALVGQYKKQTIFSEKEFRSQKLALLEAAVTTKKSSLDLAAPSAFAKFDHRLPENFFALYPQPLADNFLSENAFALQGFIKTLSTEQITQLKSKYPEKTVSGGQFNELLADRFLEVSLPASSAPHSIGDVLGAIKSTKSAGLTVKSVPGAQIAFVEVTSKTLLSEGQIEFPTQIEMDLPFAPVKADVDSVLDATQKVGANFVIILDVAASKVSRRIVAKNDISSRFISGFRSDPNPAYEVARSKLFDSQNSLANARSQSSYGLLAGVLNGVAVAMWRSNVKDAQQALSNTPAMVKSDEHQSYKYSSSDITASRTLTANYYVIDKTTNRYYKGIFDISENKAFKIAYNLHDRDPERGTILSQFSKESDLSGYEKSPMTLQVSLLIEDYLKNEAQSKTLMSIVALRDEMLADKNKALTAYKSTQYSAKPINDSRFDRIQSL